MWRSLSILASALVVSTTSNLFAQDQIPTQENEWQPLVEDYSRQQLFSSNVIDDAVRDNNALGSDAGSLAIPSVWLFPRDAFQDIIENHPREGVVCGIDLSHYNAGTFDFNQFKDQGIQFVVLKATQGLASKDSKFGEWWGALKEASPRIRRGAYHFISSEVPGERQADAFVNYVNLHGGWDEADLSPIVDLEWDRTSSNPDRWQDRGSDYILGIVVPLLKRIEARTGRKPVIYTAKSWFGGHTLNLAEAKALLAYPFWIADYNPQRKLKEQPNVLPNADNILWQFTDRALIAKGHKGAVDASVFYGSEQAFLTAFGAK